LFEATIGGTQVFSALDGDPAFTADYTRVTVDASAFADGNAHDFVFHGVQNTSQPLIFNLDDVELLACGQATADLQLAKTVTPPAVPVGGTVVFTLTATNQGPSGASGATVTARSPARSLRTRVVAEAGMTRAGGWVDRRAVRSGFFPVLRRFACPRAELGGELAIIRDASASDTAVTLGT
jgi:uncharacterized repeat protein (TIGR01451 family)